MNDPSIGASWRTFLERCEALRPELYRYCRYLTRSPWDADDLVQETLARSFVTLGCLHQPVQSPRAFLFRVASNLWLNQVRDRRPHPAPDFANDTVDPQATREAAATLITRLPPQERAAVVLKDVFELSLEEIAETLSTSVGAVKSALHRGRETLRDPEETSDAVPVPEVLNAFCAAFNARDLDRVVSLLLSTAVFEFPGLTVEYGVETAKKGSLSGVLFGDPSSDRGPIPPEFRSGVLARPPRLELRVHRGEPLYLGWFAHEDGEAVRAISRATVVGDRISRLRTYIHDPEVLAEVCAELGVPFKSSGYRYWWKS